MSIVVTNPISTSKWKKGTEYTITWTGGEDPIEYVKLYKSAVEIETIGTVFHNSEEINWTPGTGLTTGNDYLIKIYDGINTVWSDEFLIYSAFTVQLNDGLGLGDSMSKAPTKVLSDDLSLSDAVLRFIGRVLLDNYALSNYALSFDGVDDYVDCGNDVSLQITGNQTIEMKIKPGAIADGIRRNLFNKAYGGEGTITEEDDSSDSFLTYYYGTSGSDNSPYQDFGTSIKNSDLEEGQWYHIALVRDLDNMKLRWYINGVLDNEVTADYSSAGVSSNNLLIGDGYTNAYKGSIRDVRLWNSARTQQEIQDNMNTVVKTSGTTDGTTANKLEDSGADFVTDVVAVGMWIHNTTDDTWTTITAVDDLNTLSILNDIFVSGEDYVVGMGLTGNETGLAAYYKFVEGTGTTLTDYVGTNDGAIYGAIWEGLPDNLTLSDSIIKQINKVISDDLTISDSLSRIIDYVKTLSDDLTLNDNIIKQIDKVLSDNLTLDDSLSRFIGRTLSDNLTLSDLIVKGINKVISDNLTLSDAISRFIGRELSDNLTLSDSIDINVVKFTTFIPIIIIV